MATVAWAPSCGVQGGLAMRSIHMHGSEEQKQRWLPAMARGEKLGAFALTEPGHGSDSVSLETEARRDGDEYVINGAKRWIGNGTLADVVVLWARDTEDLQVKGFLIEKGTPGYDARPIAGRVRCAPCGRPTSTSPTCASPPKTASRGEQLRGHRQGAQGDPSLLRVVGTGPRGRWL